MSFEEEDPFWNSSDVKAFSFDDEDQANSSHASHSNSVNSPAANSSEIKTLSSILAAKTSSNEPFLKPSMILCDGSKIEQLIEHLDESIPVPAPHVPSHDPKTYIRNIVDLRVPIDFSSYKSKRDKLLLLDCAICCSDGNSITAATIFMSRTLKPSLFIEELKKRPIAADHYINYLEMMGQSREIIDISRKLAS